MTTHTQPLATNDHHSGPRRAVELPALVPMLWSVAGGTLLGGAVVALSVFTGRMSAHLMLVASTALFAVGAILGLAHGVALGVLGRPKGMDLRGAGRALLHGLIYLAPALLLGWFVAGWIAALPLAVNGGHWFAMAVSMLAWVAMVVLVTIAVRTGLRAAAFAFARWPDRVLGSSLTALVGAALTALFLLDPPTVWFTDRHLSPMGGVVMALGATVWLYGPAITLSLWLSRRLSLTGAPQAAGAAQRRLVSTGIAVGSGVVLAAIAVPFVRGTTGVPTGIDRVGLVSALALAVSNAVATELLLRLFVFTLVFALGVRLMPQHRGRTALLALGAAMVADVLLHWPSVAHLGLPGLWTAVAYATVRTAIPAALFGYLYWRRGLGCAVGAHATADAALVMLAL